MNISVVGQNVVDYAYARCSPIPVLVALNLRFIWGAGTPPIRGAGVREKKLSSMTPQIPPLFLL